MTRSIQLRYGDGFVPVELPDHSTVVSFPETYQDPPGTDDPVAATRAALAIPVGSPPLTELAGPGDTVTIVFPDKVKGGMGPAAHRRIAIPLILEELDRAGVRETDVKLVCAMGLHRKNTRDELLEMLGEKLVARFQPDRLLMHDAEDPEGIVRLGRTARGDVVDINRTVFESDLPIMVGHAVANPYGGYSGGYKMCATGLSTWQSIRCHHTPATMHLPDFIPSNHKGRMRDQFDEIGAKMEEGMGKPFFAVDAVLGATADVLAVHAGAPAAVREESWKLGDRRTNVGVATGGKADVLLIGMPRSFQYGPGMGTNPILMLQSVGAELARVFDVFNDGGVVIAASLCDGWFNDEYFPASHDVYDLWQTVNEPADLVPYEEQVAAITDYVDRYRHGFAYHPWYGFSMMYMGGVALNHTRAIFIVGAQSPGHARAMGCIPTATVAEALQRAERYVGRNPRVLALPDVFSTAPVHLHLA